jgi:hypothetical protein
MKSSSLALIVIVIAFIGGLIVYYYFTRAEEVSVEYPQIPSIPKYSDVIFSPVSSKPGELPTNYLDLSKEDYFTFPYSIKSSFMDRASVTICPSISYTTEDSKTRMINSECQEMFLAPDEEKVGDIKISVKEKKEELKKSIKIFVVVNVAYSSTLKGLCDLYIESGYPSCTISKNSEIKISPLLAPNPIKLDRDKSFSVDLEIEKYSQKLTINKIEVEPIETKVIRKTRDKKIEESITVDEKCKVEKEIPVEKPKEFIKVCSLPQPKIKVSEESGGKVTYQHFPLDCQNELVKKLRICEILQKEKRTEVLKKIPIFLNVSFSASKTYSYRLFLA